MPVDGVIAFVVRIAKQFLSNRPFMLPSHEIKTTSGRASCMSSEPLARRLVVLMEHSWAIIVASLLTIFAGSANAVLISADLGSPHTITSQTLPSSFDALQGTLLNGQSVSLDVSFSNSEFVRIFSVTSWTFDASIKLQTNVTGFLGFLHGTGYLVDINGNAIPGYGITGSASGSDGSLFLGLFPLLKDENGTPNTDLLRPFDFYGVHYDLIFPDVNDPSIHVTSGQFTLFSDPNGVFGIGPGLPRDIVPDSGSTLLLLGIAFLLSIGLRTRFGSARDGSGSISS